MKKDWEVQKPLQTGRVWTATFMIAAMVLALTAGCSGKRFRQSSTAMAPTIQSNEVVVVDMTAYETRGPQRWDVVIFNPPPSAFRTPQTISCMRIVGLPGESLDIRADGVYVDGKLVAQPNSISGIHYLPKLPNFAAPISFPYNIPPGSYFVMGDNTTNCIDSRFWGNLPSQGIIGKVRGK